MEGTANTSARFIPTTISTECSIASKTAEQGHCASTALIQDAAKAVGVIAGSLSPGETLTIVAKKVGCDSEKCVLAKLATELGERRVAGELQSHFKVSGPTDTTLLSNVNIDAVMQQWSHCFPFYAYNFNMRDYHKYSFRDGRVIPEPDTLATVTWSDIKASNAVRCAGCVINNDYYSGSGTHWMALFLDARDKREATIEFFNSSGKAPVPEFQSWLGKMKLQLEEDGEYESVKVVRVAQFKHQESKTECGLYSLYYIWTRLCGAPIELWQDRPIEDKLMFEFRYHLFNDSRREAMTCFDYEKYKATTQIKWE